jgi:hypothetical protein
VPGLHLHLTLAREALLSPRITRFDAENPISREAFLLGSIAPDTGYYAPGCTRLSDLAHGTRTAGLVRALMQEARDEADRAFALGWLTHFLADALIHPLVNRAAESVLRARGTRFPTARDVLLTHLQVELGLDAYLVARGGGDPAALPRGSFRDFAPLLAAAYRQTYGEPCLRTRFESALGALRRWAPLVLALSRPLGHGQRLARGVPRFGALTASTALAAPPPTLLIGVHRAFGSALAHFERHVDTELRELASVDLDTGLALSTEAYSTAA